MQTTLFIGLVLCLSFSAIATIALLQLKRKAALLRCQITTSVGGVIFYFWPKNGHWEVAAESEHLKWPRDNDGRYVTPDAWLRMEHGDRHWEKAGEEYRRIFASTANGVMTCRAILPMESGLLRWTRPGRCQVVLVPEAPGSENDKAWKKILPDWVEDFPEIVFCRTGDQNRRYLYFNRFATRKDPRMKAGQTAENLYPEAFSQKILDDDAILADLPEKTFRLFHYEYWDQEGKKRYFDCRKQRLTLDDGTVVFLGFMIDTTAQREQQKHKEHDFELLRKALDFVPVGLWARELTNGKRYLLWNHEFEKQTNVKSELVLGCEWEKIPPLKTVISTFAPYAEEAARKEFCSFRGNLKLNEFGEKHCAIELRTITIDETERILLGVCRDDSEDFALEQRTLEQIEYQRDLIAKSELINCFLQQVSAEIPFADCLALIAKKLLPVLHADQCGFSNLDEEQKIQTFEFNKDGSMGSPEIMDHATFALFHRELNHAEYIAMDTGSSVTGELQRYTSARGWTGMLAVPIQLKDREKCLFWVSFHTAECFISESDIRLVRSVAALIGLMVYRERIHRDEEQNRLIQEQTLNAIPVPSRRFTPDCRLISSNSYAKEFGLLPPGEICNGCICGIKPHPDWCPVRKTAEDGKPHRLKYKCQNGKIFLVSSLPFFDRDHKMIQIWETADPIDGLDEVTDES